MVPGNRLMQVNHGENRKHQRGYYLFNFFKLGGAVDVTAISVCGHSKAIFEKGETPTYQDDLPERHLSKAQVPIPRCGHESIRADQQQDSKDIGRDWKRRHASSIAGLSASVGL